MDAKDTVLWLGSGFSYGSQDIIENRPPLGCNFFADSNTRVLERLKAYPILETVWKAYGSLPDLERFWSKLDDDFNQKQISVPICEALLSAAFEASKTAPAHQGLLDYYKISSAPSVSSIIGQAQAVVGFELKCLIQDILRSGPVERNLLQNFWSILRRPLRVVTFNYDLYAELSLAWQGRRCSYRPSLEQETVDVYKLHGSIQWNHRIFCDRDGECRFRWANDGINPLDIREGLTCDAPNSWFGYRCHSKPCFHLVDPIMIGLRKKRELEGGEGDIHIRALFSNLLGDSQSALSAAGRIVVIGFSFSEADDYLRRHLSAQQVGSPKQLLCCYFSPDSDRKFEERVQNFFGAKSTFVHSGFGDEMLTRLCAMHW